MKISQECLKRLEQIENGENITIKYPVRVFVTRVTPAYDNELVGIRAYKEYYFKRINQYNVTETSAIPYLLCDKNDPILNLSTRAIEAFVPSSQNIPISSIFEHIFISRSNENIGLDVVKNFDIYRNSEFGLSQANITIIDKNNDFDLGNYDSPYNYFRNNTDGYFVPLFNLNNKITIEAGFETDKEGINQKNLSHNIIHHWNLVNQDPYNVLASQGTPRNCLEYPPHPSKRWIVYNHTPGATYIDIDFTANYTRNIKVYSITAKANTAPKRWILYGTLDGVTWDKLDERIEENWNSYQYTENYYYIDNYLTHRRYKIVFYESFSDTIEIYSIKFYERQKERRRYTCIPKITEYQEDNMQPYVVRVLNGNNNLLTPAGYCFNGVYTDGLQTDIHPLQVWVDMGDYNRKRVTGIYLVLYPYNNALTEMTVYASNDNNTWDKLYQGGIFNIFNFDYVAYFDNKKFYRYYKVLLDDAPNTIKLSDIYFLETNYNQEGYIKRRINGIPLNFTEQMTITASTYWVAHPPNNAFDGNLFNQWISYPNPPYPPYRMSPRPDNPQWIQVQFNTVKRVVKYSITSRYSQGGAEDIRFLPTQAPNTWYLQGSTNGTHWINIDYREGENNWGDAETRDYWVQNPGEYRYYRLYFIKNNGYYWVAISDILLYEGDTSVHPIREYEYYPIFTGFINNVNTTYLGNYSEIKIQAQDTLSLAKHIEPEGLIQPNLWLSKSNNQYQLYYDGENYQPQNRIDPSNSNNYIELTQINSRVWEIPNNKKTIAEYPIPIVQERLLLMPPRLITNNQYTPFYYVGDANTYVRVGIEFFEQGMPLDDSPSNCFHRIMLEPVSSGFFLTIQRTGNGGSTWLTYVDEFIPTPPNVEISRTYSIIGTNGKAAYLIHLRMRKPNNIKYVYYKTYPAQHLTRILTQNDGYTILYNSGRVVFNEDRTDRINVRLQYMYKDVNNSPQCDITNICKTILSEYFKEPDFKFIERTNIALDTLRLKDLTAFEILKNIFTSNLIPPNLKLYALETGELKLDYIFLKSKPFIYWKEEMKDFTARNEADRVFYACALKRGNTLSRIGNEVGIDYIGSIQGDKKLKIRKVISNEYFEYVLYKRYYDVVLQDWRWYHAIIPKTVVENDQDYFVVEDLNYSLKEPPIFQIGTNIYNGVSGSPYLDIYFAYPPYPKEYRPSDAYDNYIYGIQKGYVELNKDELFTNVKVPVTNSLTKQITEDTIVYVNNIIPPYTNNWQECNFDILNNNSLETSTRITSTGYKYLLNNSSIPIFTENRSATVFWRTTEYLPNMSVINSENIYMTSFDYIVVRFLKPKKIDKLILLIPYSIPFLSLRYNINMDGTLTDTYISFFNSQGSINALINIDISLDPIYAVQFHTRWLNLMMYNVKTGVNEIDLSKVLQYYNNEVYGIKISVVDIQSEEFVYNYLGVNNLPRKAIVKAHVFGVSGIRIYEPESKIYNINYVTDINSIDMKDFTYKTFNLYLPSILDKKTYKIDNNNIYNDRYGISLGQILLEENKRMINNATIEMLNPAYLSLFETLNNNGLVIGQTINHNGVKLYGTINILI